MMLLMEGIGAGVDVLVDKEDYLGGVGKTVCFRWYHNSKIRRG
jgi:hypothetical protein